jgi:hypothetical protein
MKQGDKSEIIPLFPFDKSPQLPPLQQPVATPAAPPPPATTTPVPAAGESVPKQ